jgi:hypothetical protein
MKVLFLILMVLGVSQVFAQVMPAQPPSAHVSTVEED